MRHTCTRRGQGQRSRAKSGNGRPEAGRRDPLLTGEKKVVIQKAEKREVDDQIYKYVGVAGIDTPRIVQIGVAAAHIVAPK
jgi:hypothetical protein